MWLKSTFQTLVPTNVFREIKGQWEKRGDWNQQRLVILCRRRLTCLSSGSNRKAMGTTRKQQVFLLFHSNHRSLKYANVQTTSRMGNHGWMDGGRDGGGSSFSWLFQEGVFSSPSCFQAQKYISTLSPCQITNWRPFIHRSPYERLFVLLLFPSHPAGRFLWSHLGSRCQIGQSGAAGGSN